MRTVLKQGWSKPSTILFATEVPPNEKAFAFALAQAAEFGSDLILFHAYDTLALPATEISGERYYDYAAASHQQRQFLEPLAERVRALGVRCEVVVRPGLPADLVLEFLREREVDRIVMGTHSPGPIGKLLVGSVAEAVLRTAHVPVCIIGPDVLDGTPRKFATRTILCAISLHDSSSLVANFAAEMAVEHNARLILQHVIRAQDRHEILAGRTVEQIEEELLTLIEPEVRNRIAAQAIVVPGDPTEELLYQSRAQKADLLVLGAQGASAFAAITRRGVVYKMLAHSHCPVMTLSPIVMAACGTKYERAYGHESFLAGVF